MATPPAGTSEGMRVVVVGATGNVGSGLLPRLLARSEVREVVGVARRVPEAATDPRLSWHSLDLRSPDAPLRLIEVVRGADAVVSLAWRLTPSHDEAALWHNNVTGTANVVRAVVEAGVPALVYASSVGTYAPAPADSGGGKGRRVDESWPTTGVPSSPYSRQKAEVERLLDSVELDAPELRIVRVRPALVFQRQAASEIARYFLGPLLPGALARQVLRRVTPATSRLRLQAVHASDLGELLTLAVLSDLRGGLNAAGEPVLDPPAIAQALGSRTLPVPGAVLRAAASLSWHLRLQPTDPGWVDLGLSAPLMSTGRARRELGWVPEVSATDALVELVDGLGAYAGGPTPVLRRGFTQLPSPAERS